MPALDFAERDRIPGFNIEGYTEATDNPLGIHPDLWDDPETFLETNLNAAVTAGFSRVILRNLAGKPNGAGADRYPLAGPCDCAPHVRAALETKLAGMLEDRGLSAWWFSGGVWVSLNADTDNVPPVPDPDNESDELDRFLDSVRDCGCSGVIYDGIANTEDTQGNNRTDSFNDLAGYTYGVHAMRPGLEAIPGDNEADYTVKPTDLDPVRAAWSENYIFADYLFSETSDYMEAFRPPFAIPAGVQAHVVLRASDSTNANIIALGGITGAAATLFALGWIVHGENSLSAEDAAVIAALAAERQRQNTRVMGRGRVGRVRGVAVVTGA